MIKGGCYSNIEAGAQRDNPCFTNGVALSKDENYILLYVKFGREHKYMMMRFSCPILTNKRDFLNYLQPP
ncbi:hypothetical protein MTR_4g125023 [Medicago truncatula]|uniref:Uncharacterized protein n=1 Tax=Medicago truncatula TaxID=3880 RepID=A0A072V2U6_MEDTR|nr:hypothetical protein MTR_4g125023 [Medicago truncatula]